MSINRKVVNKLLEKYLKSKDWDIKKIRNAFGIGANLALALENYCDYADICLNIEPLTNEINTLESD